MMTFKRLCELVNLASYEYKEDEIVKLKLHRLSEGIADAKDTIARLEAENRVLRVTNGSLFNQLHKASNNCKGVYLESVG